MKCKFVKLVFVLTLCYAGFAAQGQNLQTLKIDPKEAGEVDLEALAPDIEVVKLENSDEAIFGQIGKLLVTTNRLYIMTPLPHPRVFAFDRQGKYLFRVLPTGEGPGEVNRITTIAVDGEDLMVYGDLSRKVLRYSADGNFQKEFKLDFYAYNFVKASEGWLFCLQSFTAGEQQGARFATTDASFNVKDYFYRPQATSLGFAATHNQFMPAESGIRTVMSQSDTILNFSAGKLKREYYIDFGKYTMDKALKNREYSRDIIGRISKTNYAALRSNVLPASGLIGLTYVKNNPNGDRGKGARRLYFDPATQKIHWHFYRINLGRFQARLPVNDFAFDGRIITVASFLELFEYNKKESGKKSRSGLSEGYGVFSLDEAMQMMKADDNPYLFFYNIKK